VSAARPWPPDVAAAWARYAAALTRLAPDEADALTRAVTADPPDAWAAAAAVSAWATFRPHALLARKARGGGKLQRLLGRAADPWASPDAVLLAKLDGLAELARAVDNALEALAAADPAVRLGRLAEAAEPWPPSPTRAAGDWTRLRDHFFAAVELTETARVALAVRVLPDPDDFADRLAADGPTPELRHWYAEAAEPGLRPRLDPATLDPLDAPDPADPRVPVEAREPAGTVLGVARFAVPPTRPSWRVSTGPTTLLPTATATGWDWPADVPLAQPGLRGEPGDAPAGTVTAVELAHADPARALFTVSLGAEGSPAAKAFALWRCGNDPAFRAALAKPLDPYLRGSDPGDAGLLAVLDAVTALSEPIFALGTASTLDLLATACGAELVGPAHPDDPREDTGRVVAYVFRQRELAGNVIRVRAFGLSRGGVTVRPCETVYSAGPPPPGFADLDRLAPAAPEAVRAGLHDAVAGLRAAAANGYLEPAAVELFQLYWSRGRADWHALDPATADGFAGALSTLLGGTFGVHPFEPANVFDHPDGWVTLAPGCRVTSGRVAVLLTPGLLDAAGGLRLPARVVAE
jgi:hypothetical protein